MDSQVYLVDQVPKETLAFRDSKVHPVSQVQRDLMAFLVRLVYQELPVDQESLAVQEAQAFQATKVRQVAMESLDQLESKESQVCLVMVVQDLLVFQDCQVRRETPVFQAPLVLQVSLVLREMLASLAFLVLQVALGPLDLQGCRCRAPKVIKDNRDHLEEQVHLDPRVPVGPQEVAALREREAALDLLASLVSLDRKEILVLLDSQVATGSLVHLV